MYENLIKTVTSLGSPKILVAGDFMLDVYIYGDALRISPEAPVPVLKIKRTEYNCGGAASVAIDLAALGAAALCVGVAGKDSNAQILKKLLADAGADISGLVTTDTRPTICKQRLIGLAQHRHRQQLIRMDHENSEPLSEKESEAVLRTYKDRLTGADIVCLQDYNKGLLNTSLCREMITLATSAGKKVLVDPCLGGDYSRYRGATLITPNRNEASAAVGFAINSAEDAKKAADKLLKDLNLSAVVITLDRQGAYLHTDNISEIMPTRSRNVYDVTGAGDMVLATLAAALAAGDCDYKTAAALANVTGGLEVEKFGVATVTIDEIIAELCGKVLSEDLLLDRLKWHRSQGKKIVFTNGCFDVVHRGHIEYLKFCKTQGDVVVVGLNSDASVKMIKGPERPINNQHDRAAVLAAMEAVDYITVFDKAEPIDLIKNVRPDILVKGADWAEKGVVGREFVESYGGKVMLAKLVEGKSSTSTIEKIKSLNGNQ